MIIIKEILLSRFIFTNNRNPLLLRAKPIYSEQQMLGPTCSTGTRVREKRKSGQCAYAHRSWSCVHTWVRLRWTRNRR